MSTGPGARLRENTLPYGLFADLLVLAHVGFVAFVVLGALAVAHWPRLVWLHLPAVVWGILVEVNAWICPLTPWEQRLREAAGRGTYRGGFVEHYVLPILYPAALTSRTQFVLGLLVLAVNVAAYGWIWRRRHASAHPAASTKESAGTR